MMGTVAGATQRNKRAQSVRQRTGAVADCFAPASFGMHRLAADCARQSTLTIVNVYHSCPGSLSRLFRAAESPDRGGDLDPKHAATAACTRGAFTRRCLQAQAPLGCVCT
jgi:hypothetical protein